MLSKAEIIAILKGFTNGLEYGGKVRFVHSIVITLLFKKLNLKEMKSIFQMAWEHGSNLGLFVLIFKLISKVLDKLIGQKGINNFIGGFIGGAICFGWKKTPLNYQINLYLLSRIIMGLVKYISEHYSKNVPSSDPAVIKNGASRNYSYMLFSALLWGIVLWLFHEDKKVLQPSLQSSMDFLYIQSEKSLLTMKQLIPFWPKIKVSKLPHPHTSLMQIGKSVNK